MKTSRTITHLISVLLLLLWGGVMLYFYASGRLLKGEYVNREGWFSTMVLIGGIGCVVVGLFNLATMNAREADCCEHDHGHGHDHDDHDHSHKEGDCCGHDHAHDCGHDHGHKHSESCSHDHGHAHDASCEHDHGHKHGHSCCDHDHHHEDAEDHAGHAHGILEESGFIGRLVAIFILAVPITYASIKSPDGYKSLNTVTNRGVYDQSYKTDSKAGKFDLKKGDSGSQSTPPASKTAPPVAVAASTPPAKTTGPAANVPPVESVANAAPSGASQSKSYGSFTLKDLEAQVPKSKEGNFQLEVPEIYYTAGDKEVQGVITGQSIETIAQVIPEKVNNEKGTRVRIFRMLIQCCAADARPYSVPVEFAKEAPKFKEMSWVKVVGKMNYVKEGEQIVPIIEATTMTEAAEPDSKMVY